MPPGQFNVGVAGRAADGAMPAVALAFQAEPAYRTDRSDPTDRTDRTTE